MVSKRSLLLLGAMALLPSFAQSIEIPENKRGLPVVGNVELYEKLVKVEPAKALVDLEIFIPGIDIDIRYATKNNFTGQILYPVAKAYLRQPAAEALKAAQKDFAKAGVALRIFDAYRPYRVTEKMWETFPDPTYLADPQYGSRHNRGCAVDVTLISLETGEPLPMPTPYDDFTEQAHPDFPDLPEDILANRQLLREVMDRHGFDVYPSEWWHFDFRGWEKFEVLDLPLEKLASE